MSGHTPEPWSWNSPSHDPTGADLLGPNGEEIGMGDASSCRVDIGKAEDARRIVACVNACKGIPTEILESHGDGTGGLLDVMGIKPGEMDAELTRIRVSDAGQWALK